MQKRLKMKTNKTSALLILGGIIAAIGLTACTADSDISEQVSQPTNSNYPLSDVHAVESGIVSVQFNKNALTRSDVNELRPEDIVITPVTEAQAKSFDQTRFNDSGSSITYMYAWTTLNYRCKTADGSENSLYGPTLGSTGNPTSWSSAVTVPLPVTLSVLLISPTCRVRVRLTCWHCLPTPSVRKPWS